MKRDADGARLRAPADATALDERTPGRLRDLIGILVHDIRNPLRSMAAGAETLALKCAEDAELLEQTLGLLRSVEQMTELVNDAADLTHSHRVGGLNAVRDPIGDLDDALAIVVCEVQRTYPLRLIQARIEIGRSVLGDLERLKQLASRLLANAVLHGSPAAPIEFEASVAEGTLVIRVKNQGTPIPEQDLRNVFNPFWRQSGATSDEGLGLGLYLCSEVVKAHQGRIAVTSSMDDGTQFTVWIPVAG